MRRFLAASGEVGRDLLGVDWDATPLGPPEGWPASLQNAVRIVLTNRFSMWMAWGPELTFFCNDKYRRDTLGTKYPWALGKPASQVWSEIWEDIGPRIDRVLTTGEATWDESLQLFLERSGFAEETYHTFSYSPLADDDGRTAGMLCVVSEDTEQVISARRMRTLRDLALGTSEASEAEAIATACARLAGSAQCLPFTLTYLFDADGRTARLAGSTGFPDGAAGHPAAPAVLDVPDVVDDGDPWPAATARAGVSVVVGRLDERWPGLPTGAWPQPPTQALVVPLLQPQAAPYGFLVAGLNRYRLLDEGYLGFVQLIAGHLSSAVTDARAFEFEKQRAETLAQLDQAKTDFFTNVSHEFRTPLTLLLGPAEDALADADQPLAAPQRERVELIQRNGERLLKLVNNLLDFSRVESGRTEARFEPVDLAAYTSRLAAMFEHAASRAGLELRVECPPLPEPAYVDPEHWSKIVLNLLSNALKFTFEGGVAVALRADAGDAVLTVTDTGVGIPEHELPHLFERFHRVHEARSRTHEGSGIGLALVAELTRLHGGAVTAHSTLGEGTTFTVRLPLGSAHLPADRLSPARGEAQPAADSRAFVGEALRWVDGDPAGRTGGSAPGAVGPVEDPPRPRAGGRPRPKVLVVDDNADMRDYVTSLLAHEYDVVTATDGLEALEEVGRGAPDLVLTDVMMPRLDGFGLLRKLRSDDATVGVPVIMLSARAGEEGTVEGLEAGADDYLVKPFSARELLARVRVNIELDRVRQIRSALEQNQELLDQAQHLARVGSWEIDLHDGTLNASDELLRLLGLARADLAVMSVEQAVARLIHPEDRSAVHEALRAAVEEGRTLALDVRVLRPGGEVMVTEVRGQTVQAEDRRPAYLRGSLQDVTEQRHAERAVAAADAMRQAAAREHAIADELQRGLVPERSFDIEHLDVATYYRAGVQGTQVGGDWYDIIELGAGRTAFVVGDVMGRGVRAAAVMGQLRSAARAFAMLDLTPGEVLEHLDRMVQGLEGDQIVTAVYAVFDSTDQTLCFANAGHLPPILASKDGVRRLVALAPPLGAGCYSPPVEEVQLGLGSTVTFYTDGLVERRGEDIDEGIDSLVQLLRQHAATPVERLPKVLVSDLLPDGPDDDIAILITRVNAEPFEAAISHALPSSYAAVADARRLVADALLAWGIEDGVAQEIVLMTSELVTNAVRHGRPPIDLRLHRTRGEVVLEVRDRAPYRPRRRVAEDDEEGGRGLAIVSVLADRWGSRSTDTGKSVWCSRSVNGRVTP